MNSGKYENVSDNKLVEFAMADDHDAFAEIIRRHKERLMRSAYLMLRNTEDAYDVVQNSFIKAFKKLKQFRNESSLYTWLYSIMRNCALDFMRERNNLVVNSLEDNFITNTIYDKDSSAEKEIINNELHEVIIQAIDQLPKKQKEIIILREIENLSYKEIADLLKCNEGTVMSRLYYARETLRIILEPYTGKKV